MPGRAGRWARLMHLGSTCILRTDSLSVHRSIFASVGRCVVAGMGRGARSPGFTMLRGLSPPRLAGASEQVEHTSVTGQAPPVGRASGPTRHWRGFGGCLGSAIGSPLNTVCAPGGSGPRRRDGFCQILASHEILCESQPRGSSRQGQGGMSGDDFPSGRCCAIKGASPRAHGIDRPSRPALSTPLAILRLIDNSPTRLAADPCTEPTQGRVPCFEPSPEERRQ